MSGVGWREVREGVVAGKVESVARVVLAYLERCDPAYPQRRWRPRFTAIALGDAAPEELMAASKRILQEDADADGLTLAQYAEAVLSDPGLRAHLGSEAEGGA